MTSAHRYSLPSQNESFRLPSLKDLNFQYRSPNGAPSQPQPPQDSPNPQQDHAPAQRHASSWTRSNQNPPASNPAVSSLQSHPHQQHTPPLSAGGHEIVVPKVEYPSKHENGGYAHPGLPLSAQVTPIPGSVNTGRSEDSPHSPNHSKRTRTSANPSTSRDVRASHPYALPQYASYPPASQPPAANPYHQMSSNLASQSSHPAQPGPHPSHEQMQQQHPVPVSAHPGYGPPYQYMQPRQQPVMHQQHASNPYPSPGPPPSAPPPQGPWGQTHAQPQHLPPQHHQQPPPQQPQQHVQHPSHIQPHHQQQPPVAAGPSYMVPQHHMQPPAPVSAPQHPPQHPPPPQHQQQQPQYQQLPPPPQQQQQPSFARTTPIVPTNIDTRQQYATNDPVRNDTMAEINNHCSILYSFANRYAQLQQSNPNIQPTETELQEMSQRAITVVRLLEELRRLNVPEGEQSREAPSNAMQQSPDDPRPPKRPWEDIDDTPQPNPESNNFAEQQQYSSSEAKPQSTAEQDMELIRTKRATSTAGSTGPAGQPKSKYRKRSFGQRATPPGKCHSCNIRETPEWRRGPDGARTLCNACGLHYAKLMRKRDKNNTNGEPPVIDMETLRASARAADIADKSSRSSKQAPKSRQSEPASPMDSKQAAQHHQSSFQLVTPMVAEPSTSTTAAEASRAQATPSQQHQSMPPPGSLPPPPWATPATTSGRVYAAADHLQHQSFMRSSQHTPANHAPSR